MLEALGCLIAAEPHCVQPEADVIIALLGASPGAPSALLGHVSMLDLPLQGLCHYILQHSIQVVHLRVVSELWCVAGALERRKAAFVGAALTALQRSVDALPGVKTSDAITALLALAEPKAPPSASSKEASLYRIVIASTLRDAASPIAHATLRIFHAILDRLRAFESFLVVFASNFKLCAG